MARTILIVEDNDLFRGMLSSMLALRGYTIVVARNGTEALALAAAQPIDAVLTDVDMPEMDGFDFCARIREQQAAAGQDIPVWIMTGVFRPALAKKAAAAGAVLVLRKPFPIEEVCGALENEFQKRASAAPFVNPPEGEPPPSG
jgi:two-component system capsular synthesis sensor histidine kinase RcsC